MIVSHFSQSNRRRVLIAVLVIMVVAFIVTVTAWVRSILQLEPDSAISLAISTLEAIGLIVSLFIAIRQLVDSKEIARATFITELNKSFVENQDYVALYNALQSCFDKDCRAGKPCGKACDITEDCGLDFPKGQISNYLTFFETMYLLHKNGVVSFEIIDDLFAYRFFLAVHSKIVQQKKIKSQPQNFKNIFCLEYEWLRYRKEHGKDADPAADSVYNRLLLKDLVGEAEYKKLTDSCRK